MRLGHVLWGSGILAGFYLTAKIFFLGEEQDPSPTDVHTGHEPQTEAVSMETASLEKNNPPAAAPSSSPKESKDRPPSRTFAEYAAAVRQLKKEEKHDQALGLLREYLAAVEETASENGRSGIAAWPYEQMAIILRKENRLQEEVQILERYEKLARTLKVTPSSQLTTRLVRARALQEE